MTRTSRCPEIFGRVMTDGKLCIVSTSESGLPRHSIRAAQEEWSTWSAAATRNGETVSAVTRRLLNAYAMGEPSSGDSHLEYRATSKASDEEPSIVVEVPPGDRDTINRLFPGRSWFLEERDVSPWRPAKRRR